VHPGRPARFYSALESCGDGAVRFLLAAGSFPQAPTLQRQWYAWHGRASRRLWAASAAQL
jgi:hypothetical protein